MWKKEHESTMEFEYIKVLNEKCSKIYEEGMQIRTSLLKIEVVKEVVQNIQKVQEKAKKMKKNLNMLPMNECIVAMLMNSYVSKNINQMKLYWKKLAYKIDKMQAESLKVINEIRATHYIVKREVQEWEETLKNVILVEMA